MKTNTLLIITIVLLVISTGGTHYILSKNNKNLKETVKQAVLEIEYEKVGGKENYEKITEIQKKQIEEGLKMYEQQNGKIETKKPKKVQNNGGKTISLEQVKKVTKESVYILGNPDAEITWVEYSDLECPFCKKLHDSGAIEKILKEYDGKVNFVFKQFPLDFHPQAQMEAEASLCVGELGGKDKYYEFIQKTFDNSKSNGRSYTKEDMVKLGESIGIDKNKLLSCINSGKYKSRIQAETNEGVGLFGISGTPGNVLINNKTGKWDKLPGAYPYEAFKQKIDNLLNN